MKKAMYGITLLLSFLMVLGHELIPHHHDSAGHGNSDASGRHEGHAHHSHDGWHEHDAHHDTAKDHQGPEHQSKPIYPDHKHLYSSGDFDFVRTDRNTSFHGKQSTVEIILFSRQEIALHQTPEYAFLTDRGKPFLIRTLYQPAANALRGPPPVA